MGRGDEGEGAEQRVTVGAKQVQYGGSLTLASEAGEVLQDHARMYQALAGRTTLLGAAGVAQRVGQTAAPTRAGPGLYRPPGIRFFQPSNRLNRRQNRRLLDKFSAPKEDDYWTM
jgi:hypothetical protein